MNETCTSLGSLWDVLSPSLVFLNNTVLSYGPFICTNNMGFKQAKCTSILTTCPHWSRSLLLCWSAVPSRVYLKAHQTLSSILRSPVGCCWKTSGLLGQGLSPFSKVNPVTTMSYSNVKIKLLNYSVMLLQHLDIPSWFFYSFATNITVN